MTIEEQNVAEAMPIEEFCLYLRQFFSRIDTRAYHVLRRAGFRTVSDIIACPEMCLKAQPFCGKKTVEAIMYSIHQLGLKMSWEE